MNKVIPIIHSRKNRRAQHRRDPGGRTGLVVAATLSLVFSLFIIGSAFLFSQIAQGLPAPDQLSRLLSPPDGLLLEPTRLYDRTGTQVLWSFENPLIKSRDYVTLQTLSETEVAAATIVAADPEFYSRTNWQLLNQPLSQEMSLAQRIVSDLLFWEEPQGLPRQLRERILAAQTIAQYGRDQVLEWYLNNVYYGHKLYGVESAAQAYFGKSASDLNLAEAALLAAVGEAPALNPFDAPQAARERQEELLHNMLKNGDITAGQVRQAIEEELVFQEPPQIQAAPAYVAYVVNQAAPDVPPERLERGGFKVITSLDADLQRQADCAIQHQLARAAGEKTETDPDCQAARLLPTIPEKYLATSADLAANVVILDPRNGELLAMAGNGPNGRDSTLGESHPAGSILSPFLYLTAFTQGDKPATLVWDIPPAEALTARETHPYCGADCQYQGPVRLRIALANDYLSPAIAYFDKLSQTNFTTILRQLGITLQEAVCPNCQLAWDASAITLLDAAQAYGTLGNQGRLMGWPSSTEQGSQLRPVSLTRIEDGSGKTWRTEPALGSRSVFGAQLAYLMTHILADETARWPSLGHPNVLEIGRPVAVKIGHVGEGDSAWTVGYTPQRVTAVWAGRVGDESTASTTTETSPGLALPRRVASGLWRALTQFSTRDLPPLGWDPPPGISTMDVCDPSGMLPTEFCPEIVSEVFITGNEPVQADSLYQVREVNRETGRLATVFTPPELTEERVYLIVPPKADAWAAEQGVSTPPNAYDVVYQPSFSENLTIAAPGNFSYLRGRVPIIGTANGDGFVSYRVRLGKGLNPQTWQQYGDVVTDAVVDDLLWEWDTTAFEDGLYALEVIVLYEEQRVEKATILVSVDNTPPALSLVDVEDGQVFDFQPGGRIVFQAQADDNLGVETVEFFMEGNLAATRVAPPFVYAWEMGTGGFTLRVVARDMAGNVTEEEVGFQVIR